MIHSIGRGIIDLIQKHEPLALEGEPEACARVLFDLGDTIGGALAFLLSLQGPEAAHIGAICVLERMRVAVPNIMTKAEAEMAKRRKAML